MYFTERKAWQNMYSVVLTRLAILIFCNSVPASLSDRALNILYILYFSTLLWLAST